MCGAVEESPWYSCLYFFSMQFSPYWNGARIRAHVLVARMPFLTIGTVNLFYIVSYLIDILGV